MTPLADNILVEIVDAEPSTSALILTASSEKRYKVIAIGSKVTQVKPGDYIIYKNGFSIGDNQFVKEIDVLAILKGDL